MTLIGLTGYAQTGKNTAADIIARHTGGTVVAFADALRELATGLDPLVAEAPFEGVMAWPQPVSYFLRRHGYEWTKTHTNYRDVLVGLGAGARQHLGPNVWIDALERRLPDGGAVVADVRYLNEANWIRRRGGAVFLVQRPGHGPANDEERASVGAIVHMGAYFGVVDNSGTLDELEEQVLETCAGWL